MEDTNNQAWQFLFGNFDQNSLEQQKKAKAQYEKRFSDITKIPKRKVSSCSILVTEKGSPITIGQWDPQILNYDSIEWESSNDEEEDEEEEDEVCEEEEKIILKKRVEVKTKEKAVQKDEHKKENRNKNRPQMKGSDFNRRNKRCDCIIETEMNENGEKVTFPFKRTKSGFFKFSPDQVIYSCPKFVILIQDPTEHVNLNILKKGDVEHSKQSNSGSGDKKPTCMKYRIEMR